MKIIAITREALLKHGDLGGVFSVNNGNARMLLDDRSDPVALTELTRSGPPQGASVAERHFWHMNNADHIGAVTLQHDIVPGSEKYVKAKAALDEALSEATGSGRLIHSASREEAALKTIISTPIICLFRVTVPLRGAFCWKRWRK